MFSTDTHFTLDLFVHLDAVDRGTWSGDPDERPLTDLGERQASWLAGALQDRGVDGLFSSPALRCRGSLQPLAEQSGCAIDVLEEFCDTRGYRAPEGWSRDGDGPDPLGGALAAGSAARGWARIEAALPRGGRGVLCSYGDIIPAALVYLAGAYHVALPERRSQRGSQYTVEVRGGTVTVASKPAEPGFPAE